VRPALRSRARRKADLLALLRTEVSARIEAGQIEPGDAD